MVDAAPRGQVALITGSGRRRVGNVIARALAGDGYRVAIHYHRSEEAARETVDELRASGADAMAWGADLAREEEVGRLFDGVLGRFRRLDALVLTSSIWEAKPLEQVTAEDVRRHFEVNTLATFLCAHRGGLIMAAQAEGGAIITFGDWAIERPYADHAAYFVSKGAIPTLTRTLAVELARRNPRVRVNCIHPGPVMFPEAMSDEEREATWRSTLVQQADCPESVVSAVRFLIGNEFVTGACLPVDGGRTIFAA